MHDPLQQHQPQQGQPQGGIPYMGSPQQQFGAAPVVEEEDGWGKIGIIMVALAVAFAGGVAYFIATSGSKKDASEPTAAKAAAAPGEDADAGTQTELEPAIAEDVAADADAGAAAALIAAVPPEVATGIDAGSVAEPEPPENVGGAIGLLRANGEVDRPAGLVSLALESEPAGATVIRKRDGVRLGTTPYRYETETSAGNVSFILKLDGYKSMSVSMPGDKDGVRQVMLLPGKGGVPIPVAAPEPDSEKTKAPAPAKTATAPAKPKPKAAPKSPKKPSKPKKVSRPKKPKKPTKPKKPKKPSGGKVDYNADAIPL